MMDEEDLLDCFLEEATKELENNNEIQTNDARPHSKINKIIKETDMFQSETNLNSFEVSLNQKTPSLIHNGDTDSSDDEANRNYENQKYSEYGRELKNVLSVSSNSALAYNSVSSNSNGLSKKRISSWKADSSLRTEVPKYTLQSSKSSKDLISNKNTHDVYMEPIFGMRLINPQVSNAVLIERMKGKLAVKYSDLSRHIMTDNLKNKDWVISGVVVSKSTPKTSQKGNQYSIWTLTDLKDDIKTFSLFMFSSAHSDLWKTSVGTAIGILNPNIMNQKESSKNEVSLSISTSQKVMIFGQSKDFGICKSIKKNGERCNSIVNLSKCEFCIYHIKQEYQKCSKRSELQSNFAGQGLINLRNKVLGKNEVFYAGKSYMAIPAKKSKKLEDKDKNILQNLSSNSTTANKLVSVPSSSKGVARNIDLTPAQRAKDLKLLEKLCCVSSMQNENQEVTKQSVEITLKDSRAEALNVIQKLKISSKTTILEQKQKMIETNKSTTNFSKRFNESSEKNCSLKQKSFIDTSSMVQKSENSSGVSQVTSSTQSSQYNNMVMGIPILSGFDKNDTIDLNKPVGLRHVERAKMNAIKFIQRHGPIKKLDPNSSRNSKKRNVEKILEVNNDEHPLKKSKLQETEFISDRFKKMMAMTSKHASLLEQHDNEEKEKYFNKLEVKEQIEEKMVNTHKIKCKAVKCLQCKYTSFSASDLCKTERHTLKVCKRFNDVGSKLLSRGFIQLEKRHSTIYKRVKSALPRRESERKTHPLSKHSDILQAVETRMSMLNMTYTKFIDHKLICFLPGKVLDELKSILDLVDSNNTPPRTHLLLQELRDLSSMAMEHFEEHILPRCKEQLERRTGPPEKILKELELVAGSITPYKNFRDIISTNGTSTSKPGPRIFPLPLAISNEIYKVKKVAKSHKQHIGYLTLSTQKLCLKLRRTTSKLRIQSAKIRQQERQIREQNSKILEQEASLNDIKKHIDEWDQKYKDLTAELVRARDEMLLKTSTTTNSVTNASSSTITMMNTNNVVNTLNFSSQTTGLSLMSNIKPRVAHILPKSYLKLDCERKRKSTLNAELPSKRSRSPTTMDNREISKSDATQKNSLNISDLVNFEKRDCMTEDNGNSLTRAVVDTTKSLVSCFSGLSNNAPNSVKPRKRKMTEDIDLK